MFTLPENISCGYCDCSEFGNLKISPKRKVTTFEIEFYLENGKTTTTDNRTFEIKKNYIQIAKPGQIRHSRLPFKTAYIKFSAQGELARIIDALPEYFSTSNPGRICNEIDEIILLNEQGNHLMLYSRLLSLLNLIVSDAKKPLSRKNGEIVSKAKRFIEANFDTPLNLKAIAESVHLSEIYFHNVFTESTGISPHQYLINCRIEGAKKLLWNSLIPICVVAEKSGFGCQQYLNKVFKKETGQTPLQYRKSFQQNYSL